MGRAKSPKKVRRYSAEFKLKAVKLSQLEGVKVQDVAEALGIKRAVARVSAAGARPTSGHGASPFCCWQSASRQDASPILVVPGRNPS